MDALTLPPAPLHFPQRHGLNCGNGDRARKSATHMALEELYLKVKTLTRQLGLRESLDVVWAYSQYLQVAGFGMPADIEVADQFLAACPPQAMLAE